MRRAALSDKVCSPLVTTSAGLYPFILRKMVSLYLCIVCRAAV